MKTLQWNLFDKSAWADGEWKSEPDKMQWQDKPTGYPCLLRRNDRTGSLCGYVGVSKSHPLYGYYDAWSNPLDVHGGVNYAGKCNEHICHQVEEGEDDDIWWMGFDCAHAWDIMPVDLAAKCGWVCSPELEEVEEQIELFFKPEYRNVKYVKEQCASLAQQLKEIDEQYRYCDRSESQV